MISQPGSGRADFLSDAVSRRLISTARNASPCRVVANRKMFTPRITESWAAITATSTERVQR